MPKVEHVASYLLSISKPGTSWSITPLKLQKLLYYCQGWHMAYSKGNELFDEEMEAWDHGPVVPEIYHKYKHHKYLTIPKEIFENKNNKGKPILSNKQLDIINAVWETYGEYDGKYLEELTHQEDPWIEAPKDRIIKKDKILQYFNRIARNA
ncbi:Panacea domain-containing protein [Bacillus licheniformis]|uniref:Panacea domain-containing protein n=1 Tax=Bacillus licheniformis TaxID=1402 RepID=UPI0040463031